MLESPLTGQPARHSQVDISSQYRGFLLIRGISIDVAVQEALLDNCDALMEPMALARSLN